QEHRVGLTQQRVRSSQQEHPQGIREALYTLADVEDEPMALEQMFDAAQADEGVVAEPTPAQDHQGEPEERPEAQRPREGTGHVLGAWYGARGSRQGAGRWAR